MKQLFQNAVLFAVAALGFSGLTGCGAGANSPGTTTNDSLRAQANTSSPDLANAKTPSQYPPLVSSVAQADIKNLDGSTFKVADKKGKVLLLNMWATWCGPCRAEMPALVRMQNEFRDQGFEVIGLNTDDEAVDEINEFAKSMDLNYILAWADTKLQAELLRISQFQGIPQSFLVDRDGHLRGVFRGAGAQDIARMEQLVAKVVRGDSDTPPPTTGQHQPNVPSESSVSLRPDASEPGSKSPAEAASQAKHPQKR